MVDYDSMGPTLQRVRAQFLNFFLSKLSNFAECRSYRTFKRPYFHIAGRYNHMVRYAVLCMLI